MPDHTLQILRLLRFAGLMLLLGSVASASAQTVGERLKKDPDFRIYAVVFGVTATTNSKPPAVRLVRGWEDFRTVGQECGRGDA